MIWIIKLSTFKEIKSKEIEFLNFKFKFLSY